MLHTHEIALINTKKSSWWGTLCVVNPHVIPRCKCITTGQWFFLSGSSPHFFTRPRRVKKPQSGDGAHSHVQGEAEPLVHAVVHLVYTAVPLVMDANCSEIESISSQIICSGLRRGSPWVPLRPVRRRILILQQIPFGTPSIPRNRLINTNIEIKCVERGL